MSKRPDDPGYAPGWCIHYRAGNGGGDPMPATCEAGVEYAKFRRENFNSTFAQQPCFLTKTGESKTGALPCEHLRRPTTEEIAAHEEWATARWRKTATALAAIEPWRKENKGRSASQTIDCPVCAGVKTFSMMIVGRNGHVHARCSTPECVSWIE